MPTPEDFDLVGQYIPDEKVAEAVVITDAAADLLRRLRQFEQLGFTEIYLHQVAQEQGPFLELAEHALLPALRA